MKRLLSEQLYEGMFRPALQQCLYTLPLRGKVPFVYSLSFLPPNVV